MPTRVSTVDPVATGLTSGPDLTRYVLVCLGLVALVLFLAWFFRRFVAESVKRRAAKRSLRVVDVLPLGGKRRLAVVQCYDRCFLIGLGEKEVTSIAELDEPEPTPLSTVAARRDVAAVEERIEEEEVVVPKAQFAATLREALRGPKELHRPRENEEPRWKRGEGILG
ncbi:MAG TPA: flagellar biosynthetic protein FliO [Planctomycetes bacterium]|nr:flagellar biosynthetic protein FliO [Planctomycetota bacterium]